MRFAIDREDSKLLPGDPESDQHDCSSPAARTLPVRTVCADWAYS